jgi:hypothetical protein
MQDKLDAHGLCSWAAAASVAGSLIGGAMSSNAAGQAGNAQVQASQAAIAEQQREFNTTQSNNAPFMATGTAANQRLGYLLGVGPQSGFTQQAPDRTSILNNFLSSQSATYGVPQDQLDQNFANSWADNSYNTQKAAYDKASSDYNAANPNTDPAYGSLTRNFTAADMTADPVYASGYAFAQKNAADTINARGEYDSGATLKALQAQGVNVANQYGNDAYNRYNTNNTNTYNRLAGVSGTGQTAVNTVASAGANAANNISQLQTGIGNANAASIVGGANAWGGALTSAANNYQSNQTLQALLNRNQNNTSGYTGMGIGANGAVNNGWTGY